MPLTIHVHKIDKHLLYNSSTLVLSLQQLRPCYITSSTEIFHGLPALTTGKERMCNDF